MSSTTLKIIALVFMAIDHIWEFVPGMPIWFHWIGRLSAPIFFFCMAWGFFYTRDRVKYLGRLYLFGVCMAFINDLLNYFFMNVQPHTIDNNIFINLFIAGLLIWIIETFQSDKRKAKRYFVYFIIEQIVATTIVLIYDTCFYSQGPDFAHFLGAVFFSVPMAEGGFPFVVLPIILYFGKNNKKNVVVAYLAFCGAYLVFYAMDIVPRILMYIEKILPETIYFIALNMVSLLGMRVIPTYHVRFFVPQMDQWMMIFALPFLLTFNGRKGSGYKYLFYAFYPMHIYILYIIGILLN